MAPHCPNKNIGNCSSVPQPTNSGPFRQNRSTEKCKSANGWLVCRLRGVTRSSESQACSQPALNRVSCTFSSFTSGKFYTDRPASHCSSSSLHTHPSHAGWLSSSGSREKNFQHQSRCRRSLFSLILLALMLGLASTVSSSVSGLNAETIWPYPLSSSPSPPLIPLHSTPTLVHHLKQPISSFAPAALALPPKRTSKMSLQSTSTKSGSFESVALAPPLGSALTKPDQTKAVFSSLAVHLPIGPKHSTLHDLSRPTKNSQTWPRSHFVLGSTLQQANLQQLFNSSDNQTTFQPTGSPITSNSRTPATTAAPFLQLHRPTRQGRKLTKRQAKLDSLLGQLMINHDRYLRNARESNQLKRSTIIRRTAMPMFSNKRSSLHEAWPAKSSFSTPSTRLLNRWRRSQHQKSVSQQQQQQLAQQQQFFESLPMSPVESNLYLPNGPHHFHSLPESYLSPIEDHSKIVRQFRSPQPDQVPMFMSVNGLESVESQQQSQQQSQQYQLPHYSIVPKSLQHQYRLFPQFNRYPRFVTSFMHSSPGAYSGDSDAIHDRFRLAPSSRVHEKELQEQEEEQEGEGEDEMPATDALSLYRSINRNPNYNYYHHFGYKNQNQNKRQEESEDKDKDKTPSSLHHHTTAQSDYQTRGFLVKRQKSDTILTLDPILNNQQEKRKSGEIIHKQRDVNQDNRKQKQPSVVGSGDNQSNTLLQSNGNDDGAGNGNEMNIGMIAPSMLNGARPNNNNNNNNNSNSNSQSNRVLNNKKNRSDNRNNNYSYYYNHHQQNYFHNNNNNNKTTSKKHPMQQPINDRLNGSYAGYYYSRYGSNGPGAGYQSGNRNSRNDHYEHFDDNHFNDNGNSHGYFNQNQQELQAKIYKAAAIAAAAADARSNDSPTNRGLSGAIRWRNRLALVANLFDRHQIVQKKRFVPSSFRSNQTARSGGVVPWSWWWWNSVSNSSHQPYQPNKSDLISSASYLRSPFRLSTFPPPLSDFPIDPTLDFNFETQTQKRSSYYRPSIEPKVGISQSGTVHLRRAGSRNFDNYYYGNRSHNPNLANNNNNNNKSRTKAKQGQYSRAQPYRSSHNYYQSSSRSSSSSGSSKQQNSPPYEFGIGRSELQRAQQSKIISPSRVQSSRLDENRYWKSQSKSSKPSQNRENLNRFGDKPRPNKQPTQTVSQSTRHRYGSSETIDQGIVRVSAANTKPVSHNGLSRVAVAGPSSTNSFQTNKQSSSSSGSWSTSPKHHTSFVAISSYSDKQPKQSDAQQASKTGFSTSIASNQNGGGDERGTKDKPAPVYGQYASNYSESNNSPKMRGSRNANGKPLYDVAQIECPISENGMERFACPSADSNGRYLCIDDQHICNGYSDCPKGEDEDSMSCMFYRSTKAHLDVLADYLLQWARGRHSK